MIEYLKFLISYLGFWHNKTNKPFYIYNENKYQNYNKMYISK